LTPTIRGIFRQYTDIVIVFESFFVPRCDLRSIYVRSGQRDFGKSNPGCQESTCVSPGQFDIVEVNRCDLCSIYDFLGQRGFVKANPRCQEYTRCNLRSIYVRSGQRDFGKSNPGCQESTCVSPGQFDIDKAYDFTQVSSIYQRSSPAATRVPSTSARVSATSASPTPGVRSLPASPRVSSTSTRADDTQRPTTQRINKNDIGIAFISIHLKVESD
jgi:hypothetical protein